MTDTIKTREFIAIVSSLIFASTVSDVVKSEVADYISGTNVYSDPLKSIYISDIIRKINPILRKDGDCDLHVGEYTEGELQLVHAVNVCLKIIKENDKKYETQIFYSTKDMSMKIETRVSTPCSSEFAHMWFCADEQLLYSSSLDKETNLEMIKILTVVHENQTANKYLLAYEHWDKVVRSATSKLIKLTQ